MWITLSTVVLLLATQCWARESLRGQVAMLRREQWRDRERLEALERRVLGRGERDSPSSSVASEGIFEIFEEVSREIAGLSDELRQRQWLEEAVAKLQERHEEELETLQQLSRRVEVIEQEQRRVSHLVLSSIGNIRKEDKPLTVRTANPWTEEGSGDLVDESFFPAEISKKAIIVPNDVRKEANKTEVLPKNINHGQETVNGDISNLFLRMQMVERQTKATQEGCTQLISNVTDDIQSSLALLENLQDDLSNLWKRVVKVDFNAAQSQTALDVLEHDWTEDRKSIYILQNGTTAMQRELNEHNKRLLTLEMQMANVTLQRCRGDGEASQNHLQMQNMDLRLTQFDHRIDEWAKQAESQRKVNENVFRSYRDAISNIAKRTHNISGQISELTNDQTDIRIDVDKFVRHLPKDCSLQSHSEMALIQVPSIGPLEVYCDVAPDGEPWIVVQKRFNGSESFFRGWIEYRNGFGELTSEFWLGNEALHLLTDKRRMKLHIDMWDVHDRYLFTEYETFRVSSEMEQYAIRVANHTGNASDALSHHIGMGFSTFDRDNDASSANCAVHHTGGWWYQHCHRADLNGRYSLGMTWYDEYNQEWLQLARVEMKIAPNES